MTIQTPSLTAEQYVRIAVLDTLGAPVGAGELEMWDRIARWVETGEVPADRDDETYADIAICKSCGAACYADETCGRCSAGIVEAEPWMVACHDCGQVDCACEPEQPAAPSADERRAAVVAAIKSGHVTNTDIREATGIPRGSMSALLNGMVTDGLIRRDDSGARIVYDVVDETGPEAEPDVAVTPKPAAEPAPSPEEELKRQWLEKHGPSTSANLGPHEAMVEFIRRDLCMFVAKMPAGTKGRAQWRYGEGTVDTNKLYSIGNAERKRRGLDPIPVPKEDRP